MRKITTILSILVLLCSIFIPYSFISNVEAIGQHEVADGTVFGEIYNETGTEGIELDHFDTADDGCDRLFGVCTDGNYIWVIHNELWFDPGDNDIIYKYNMDGTYTGTSWDYTAQCGEQYAESITTDGTNIWVFDSLSDYEVYKFTMDGVYTDENWSTVGADGEGGITTDGNHIWILDSSDNEVFQYNMDGTYTGVHWDLDEISDEPFWNPIDITTDGKYIWIAEYHDNMIYKLTMDGVYTGVHWVAFYSPYGITTDGKYIWIADYWYNEIYKYSLPETFNVTRTIYTNTEKNEFSFNPIRDCTEDVTLKIPMSNDVQGIVSVTNNSDLILADEVNTTGELINNTYWYDSANQFVHIRTINLTTSSTVNWTVNCSYGVNFNIHIPLYKIVGDDIIMSGSIKNDSGNRMNVETRTHMYFPNGTDALLPVHDWYCDNGNYFCTLPTSTLIPGIYQISIEITDPDSGIIFKEGSTLYLSYSVPGGSGIYSNAIIFFSFYNTNIGLGLIPETFKVYIDNVRNYFNEYYGYIGETINITVKDYYNFTMHSENYTITRTYTGLNFGLTFHEYFFTNENSEYFYASFLKSGADRWYELVVPCSGGYNSFMLPTGNYTIRVYNYDNSTYLSWNETVNRSKAYLIGEDGVSLIIQGQSVIIGEFLELNADLDAIFMPDVEIISRNPPIIFSVFDRIGMDFGGTYFNVCPPINVIADTRYEETGSNITNSALIPTNGTTENGSITLLEDTIYFSVVNGTAPAWVNITYANNGTLIQNTTNLPARFYPFGFEVVIVSPNDIHIIRECRFNQLKKFDWQYYPGTDNPGWLWEGNQKRVGYHRAGLEAENTMNTIWYNVHVYAGFSTDTPEPDGTTIRLTDVDNGNEILDESEHYFVLGSGLAFRVTGSLAISETRSYIAEYYSSMSDQYYYGSEVININAYQENKRRDEKLYSFFEYTWINPYDRTFRGTLKFSFDFEVETGIKQDEIIVYDAGTQTNITDFIICDSFLEIGGGAVGDVNPGSGKTYEVYFKFERYPGQDLGDTHMNTPQFRFGGADISMYIILILIFLGIAIFGVIMLILDRKQKKTRKWATTMIMIGMLGSVLIWVLTSMGI